ncbi:MAG TPA: hypothetical protein VHO07_21800 [Streptosporangiaceae bacterium]|nr:hypothetical protein [Streptosporangiaceae bacterium]
MLHPGERGIEIPVSRPISGNVRGDLCHGSEHCFGIWLATLLLQSEVLHEGERSTPDKDVSGLLPADLRINPVKSGRREHGPKLLAGKQCILKLSVHEFHFSGTVQVLPGQCDEALARFECCDVQAPSEEAARQLAASAPDLKYMITAADPCDQARLVDEFVRIRRTAAVVLSRDLIKNLAVTSLWVIGHPPMFAPRHASCPQAPPSVRKIH